MWDRISSTHSPWNLLAVERATPSSPSFRSKTLKSTLIPLSYTPNPFTSVFCPPAYTNTQNPTAPLLPWAAILPDEASRVVQGPSLLPRQATIISPTGIFAVHSSLFSPFLPQSPHSYTLRLLEWVFSPTVPFSHLRGSPGFPTPPRKETLCHLPH